MCYWCGPGASCQKDNLQSITILTPEAWLAQCCLLLVCIYVCLLLIEVETEGVAGSRLFACALCPVWCETPPPPLGHSLGPNPLNPPTDSIFISCRESCQRDHHLMEVLKFLEVFRKL